MNRKEIADDREEKEVKISNKRKENKEIKKIRDKIKVKL